MLIIITNIVKYTLLYTVDTVKYSMNTEDILEELTKVDNVSPITLELIFTYLWQYQQLYIQ